MSQASSKNTPAEASGWVALGAFAQPHGVSGRIKVKSFTDPLDDFANHTPLTDESGTTYKLKITGHTQGMAIVSVEGITDRNQAELLRGKKIGVARSTLPELENPGSYYIDDLIGMAVIDESGAAFGTVINVVNYGASDILEIRRPDRRHQKTADAGSPRRRQHRRPIAVELGGVQMAVGVDQHGARRGVTYPSRPACAWP